MASDEEFPPLLAPGLRNMSLAELKILAVDNFPHSTARKSLWNSFVDLVVTPLANQGLACSIWVDGSFLTEKIEPNDIDFVVDFPEWILTQSTPQQQALIEQLNDKHFRRFNKLHSFVMYNAPAGHIAYARSVTAHEQWKKDFGQSYIGREPKGIAVIEVAP